MAATAGTSTIQLTDLGCKPSTSPTIIVDGPALAKETSDAPEIESNSVMMGLTRDQKTKGNLQFLALCWTLFLCGWNDGTTGPLLPRIREVYHVGFAVVSLLFVLACVGFIAGALINVPLSARIGFGKILALGSVLQIVAYSLQAPALPFPAFILSFLINGIGIAMQDAQANGYVAAMPSNGGNAGSKLGILHAAYGAGAFAAPLVATQFAQHERWSFFYLISLGISVANTLALVCVFRLKSFDECLKEAGKTSSTQQGQVVEGDPATATPSTSTSESDATLSQILRHKNVHLLSVFILVYVGIEVTIGGWIVTFLIDERSGGPSAGYVSAGFFGGLMVGRVALLWVNKLVGEHRVIFGYAALAVGLEFTVWFVPSLIQNAVAVSLVGLLLGPMYPITINQASRVLPGRILTGSIGWIAGFGQAGSAVFPFMTGALSSKFGTKSLQPLIVALMAVLTLLWGVVPKRMRKED